MPYVYTRKPKLIDFVVKSGKDKLYTLELSKPDTEAILEIIPVTLQLEQKSLKWARELEEWDSEDTPPILDTREQQAQMRAFVVQHLHGISGIVDENGVELGLEDLGSEGVEDLLSEWGVDHLNACVTALVQSSRLSPAVGNDSENM